MKQKEYILCSRVVIFQVSKIQKVVAKKLLHILFPPRKIWTRTLDKFFTNMFVTSRFLGQRNQKLTLHKFSTVTPVNHGTESIKDIWLFHHPTHGPVNTSSPK